jgi:hypothetical protein
VREVKLALEVRQDLKEVQAELEREVRQDRQALREKQAVEVRRVP